MEFRYQIKLTEQGLPAVDEAPDAELHIRHDDGQIYIVGNESGLLQLARHLIGLALVPNQPRGYHVHLEPDDVLDHDSTSVIIHNEVVFRER